MTTRLAAIAADGRTRSLRSPAGVDLCSNDYLGLATHPHLVDRFIDAARREGCGSTGSRLLRGERESFSAIEQRFARFKGAERALYFSSGYLANLAVLTALPEEGDVILSDERNHASLIDGARLSRARTMVVPHSDPAALRRDLSTVPAGRVPFVVIESVFSMDGDMALLGEYADLCRSAGAVLVVDEAHAVGVYGDDGSGLLAAAPGQGVGGPVVISVNTAGKALGVSGAFVAGPAWAIEYLVQRARPFIFSTAPPPAVASAIDESLNILRDEPDRRGRLHARAAYLRTALSAAHVDVLPASSQIIAVMIGGNEQAVFVANVLQGDGFDVRAIRPPTVPPGTARLRVSVNAGLTEDVLDRFVARLVLALKEAGHCSAVPS